MFTSAKENIQTCAFILKIPHNIVHIGIIFTSFLKVELQNCYIDRRNRMNSIKIKKFHGKYGK